MAAKKPSSLTIRTYGVGFGDCFLLSFQYAGGPKHVLIDFGSTANPEGARAGQMMRIAKDIQKVTAGKLHAVVGTHRHKDHISGFATNKAGTQTGDIIRKLKPDLVIQPWTEQPDLQQKARKPTKSLRAASPNVRSLAALEGMHGVADAAWKAGAAQRALIGAAVADQLGFIGEDNVKNVPAIKNLQTMGKKSRYIYYGQKSGLESILPGVKVHVLGPPTLEQSSDIEKERARDPDEFWQFWKRQGLASATASVRPGVSLFPREVLRRTPPSLRWFRKRIAEAHGENLLELVTILDDAMNNTSVILLFDVGGKRLLFPGDAQIENWQYALSQDKVRKLLRGTTLYKVGHHGSLNATPKKQLWPLLTEDRKGPKLLTLLSTREHKHGSEKKNTEVPRRTLVTELKQKSKLVNTLDLKKSEICFETTLDL